MKRRDFLRRLGIGVTSVVVAPATLLQKKEEPVIKAGAGIMSQIESERNFVLYTGAIGREKFDALMKEMFNESN